jgi:site-specific recombinase XerD
MPSKPVTTLTLETIDRYRQWCIGRGRSENTVRAYTSDLKVFLTAAGERGEVTMTEFEELAMSWLNLTRAMASPKTTARRLTSVRGFAKWAGWGVVLEDYIAPTPGKTIPHPLPEGLDGVQRMCDVAKNDQQAALVALGGFVGCRISESLSLTVHSFDLHDMLLTIRGKGDKTRVVPVNERAWGIIAPAMVGALHKPDKRLISYKDRFARQIVTNLGARAKLQRSVSSHDLRATFATAALDRTKNIRVVQELLGHANSSTTEIYTGIGIAQMREAVQF